MSILYLLTIYIFGLIFGSFINALVWRMGQQLDNDGNPKKLSKSKQQELSITKGRSMCPSCKHKLAAKDLVPVISWIILKGKCRYCKKPISYQYPTVEFATAILFIASYMFWPFTLNGAEWVVFGGYIIALICLIAMAVYDYKYTILPSRLIAIGIIVYSLALIIYGIVANDIERFGWAFLAGVFYFILFFAIYLASMLAVKNGYSSKDWLGGGDVKLAFLLGLIVGEPILVFLAMFLASIVGIVITLPSLITGRTSVTSQIPFGPFLITGAILSLWWGADLLSWYTSDILRL